MGICRIFTMGETVLDIIFENGRAVTSTPGGAMLNSAVSLGRLGCNVFLISEIADDLCGKTIINFLRKNHVNDAFLTLSKAGQTTVAMAFLDENKEAFYNFYRSEIVEESFSVPDFSNSDLLLFGSFYSLDENNRDKILKIIRKAKEKKTIILYDPNIRKAHCPLSEEGKQRILENFSYSDMVRGSHEDFENVFGTDDPDAIFQIVRQQGCRHLFLTKGADGIYYKTESYEAHFSVKPIQPISSIGAGDTFNAGILYEIAQLLPNYTNLDELLKYNILHIIQTASEMAAQVCMSMDNYITIEN